MVSAATRLRIIFAIPLAALVIWITSTRYTWLVSVVCFLGLLQSWREFLPLVLPGRVPKLFFWIGSIILAVLFVIGVYAEHYFMLALSIAFGVMFMLNLRDYVATAFNVQPAAVNEKVEKLIPLVAAPMGLIYVLTLMIYLPKIHMLPQGNILLSLFFFGIWATDTGAYFAGRLFGKNLLAPTISPKKTWEGLGGGVVLSAVFVCIYKYTLLPQIDWLDVAVLTFLLGPLAQLGDLAESLLKRTVDKKDSGNIIPGHGGMLDRCDGFLLSAPLFYLYISLRFFG